MRQKYMYLLLHTWHPFANNKIKLEYNCLNHIYASEIFCDGLIHDREIARTVCRIVDQHGYIIQNQYAVNLELYYVEFSIKTLGLKSQIEFKKCD
jgi:hypothetical protein